MANRVRNALPEEKVAQCVFSHFVSELSRRDNVA